MRAMTLGFVAAAALATAAAAQTDFEAQHHMLQARSHGFAAPGSPLSGLTKASQAWIAAETQRQVEAPTALDKLAIAVDAALHEDEVRVARANHLDTLDIVRAIVLQITNDADEAAQKSLKVAQASSDLPTIRAASEKAGQAAANHKRAMDMQTDASLVLAGF